MGWLYVGSVLIRERVNVSPGWSAHITTDDSPLPEHRWVSYQIFRVAYVYLNLVLQK